MPRKYCIFLLHDRFSAIWPPKHVYQTVIQICFIMIASEVNDFKKTNQSTTNFYFTEKYCKKGTIVRVFLDSKSSVMLTAKENIVKTSFTRL